MKKQRLAKILNSMRSKTLYVVGDLILDEYVWGNVERISPEAPVPVVEVHSEELKLGGAGNVAKNLTSLGAKVIMAGVVGKDAHGAKMAELFQDHSISHSAIIATPDRKTSVKTRVMAHTQQVVRIDKEEKTSIPASVRDQIVAHLKKNLKNIHGVIISDYGKGVIDKILIDKVVDIARGKGLLVSVDPKERNFSNYRRVSLITPNAKELSFGAGFPVKTDSDVLKAATKVKAMLECDMVLVTRGEKGMSLLDKDEKIAHVPTMAKAVYDVTGAGDTVISCFTLAIVSGATPLEAAKIANLAAGMVVAEVGTATVAWKKLYKECMEALVG
jgi:D-beta-D-heptose 7-phosphate kinase/D-beta-D-heptose 1-phosphate adenosyltransferase